MPQGNYFAFYSNRDPMHGKRLSANPFKAKTAAAKEEAWKGAFLLKP